MTTSCIEGVEATTYYIAQSADGSIVHYGCVPVGSAMITGQPTLRQFSSCDEVKATLLSEFGIDATAEPTEEITE